jgi:lipopolysaccharide export system permease protein
MRRLDRYLLRHLVVATFFVTVALTLAIWLTQSLRIVELVLGGGAPLGIFLEMVGLTLPTFLGVVLPVGLVAAVIFTYNRLNVDSEIVIMRAVGLSPWALSIPAGLLSLAMMVAMFILNLYITPAAYRQLEEVQRLVQNDYLAVFLRPGVFNDVSDGLTVYMRDRASNGEMLGLLIQDTRSRTETVTIMAERGVLVSAEAGTRVVVFDGNRQSLEKATGKLSQLYFNRYTVDLQVYKPEFGPRWVEPRERTVSELLNPTDSADDQANLGRFKAELTQRFSTPFHAVAFTMVGLACLLSGEFNRRGQYRRILIATLLILILQSASLGLINLVAINAAFIPVVVVVSLGPIVAGVVALRRTDGRARRNVGLGPMTSA